MLKRVVLPAPFGPIRLAIEPRATAKSTSATATRPPNSLRICRTSIRRSSFTVRLQARERPDASSCPDALRHPALGLLLGLLLFLVLVQLRPPAGAREQALGPDEHEGHDRDAVDQVRVLVDVDVRAERRI